MLRKLILTLLIVGCGSSLWAQESDSSDNSELEVIELELEKSIQKKSEAVGTSTTPLEKKGDMDFSGLGGLAPFSEVSVIQKRYMPKTGRFQLFAGINTVTNNPFFDTNGFSLRGAYFFRETWGIEASYLSLSTSEAKSTKELKDIQNVTTENLIYPKSYMGVDAMWVPLYGKFTWFNQKIVPFDMYFSAGYGTTSTQADEKPGTFHLATGQMFAISKGFAARWDFSWNMFSAKGIEDKASSFNMLYLTIGASWFFPEAKYR